MLRNARPQGLAGHESARGRRHHRDRGASKAATDAEGTNVGDYVLALVKWYNNERGYGFVTREAVEGDVFVHAAVLRRHGMELLTAGQKVMVRVADGQKGLQVVEIQAV